MNGVKQIWALLFTACALMILFTSCEYDVEEPGWDKPFEIQADQPEITRIEPDSVAAAGVNYITIFGKNFAGVLEDNYVYFEEIKKGKVVNVVNAEIVVDASSDTSITVRRPNLISDSCIIKLNSYDALVVAKYSSPYKIDPVMERYGSFVENVQLGAIAIDSDENMYVIQNDRLIFKVTPDGEKTNVGQAARAVYDAKISPEGKLILLINNNEIHQLDLAAGVDTTSVWIEVDKRASYGDFDSDGNFYTGGNKSDLIVVAPDGSSSKQIGVYSNDEIFCVRVYNDGYNEYVYVLAENAEMAIWRHEILDANGNLGVRDMILNWANAGDFAASEPRYFTFSDDGTMYIGTDNTNPIMILNTDGSQDILYKGILPSTAEQLVWGTGKYLYMLLGGEEWNIIRIDMGDM